MNRQIDIFGNSVEVKPKIDKQKTELGKPFSTMEQ